MVKKFSMLALAGLIALPAVASASGGANANDLERKITLETQSGIEQSLEIIESDR